MNLAHFENLSNFTKLKHIISNCSASCPSHSLFVMWVHQLFIEACNENWCCEAWYSSTVHTPKEKIAKQAGQGSKAISPCWAATSKHIGTESSGCWPCAQHSLRLVDFAPKDRFWKMQGVIVSHSMQSLCISICVS